jgi:hypothetical protein
VREWVLTAKDFSIAITESHLVSIPKGIVHTWWAWDIVVMNGGDQMKAIVIDRVSSKDLRVEFMRFTEEVEHLLCIIVSNESGGVTSFFVKESLSLLVGLC